MKVHLWKAYDPIKISVDLSQELKDKIKELIKQNIHWAAREIGVIPTRLYDYFIYQKAPIPLEVLMNLSTLFKISLEEIEENIILYKQMYVPRNNSVGNPLLPLKITPCFTSIIANLYFDGSVPKDGKGTYYNQKRGEIMEDFIEKVKVVFGGVQYSLRKDHREVLKCRIPRIIGEICMHIYEIKSFGSFDSRISKKIFSLPKEHKESFVLTAIFDEGSIAYDGTIMFGVSNKKLCEDVRILCNQVGLETNIVKNKRNSDYFYFHIKSIKKFYQLATRISKKYPFISLRHKLKRLKISLDIRKQPSYNTKKFADKRKNNLLVELKIKESSVNNLSSKFLFPPRTIRRYMYQLMKENIVSRKKIGNQYIYFVLG